MAARREVVDGPRKMARSHFGSLAVPEAVSKVLGEPLSQGCKVTMEKTIIRATMQEKSGLSGKGETIMDQAHVHVSWEIGACFGSVCEM